MLLLDVESETSGRSTAEQMLLTTHIFRLCTAEHIFLAAHLLRTCTAEYMMLATNFLNTCNIAHGVSNVSLEHLRQNTWC